MLTICFIGVGRGGGAWCFPPPIVGCMVRRGGVSGGTAPREAAGATVRDNNWMFCEIAGVRARYFANYAIFNEGASESNHDASRLRSSPICPGVGCDEKLCSRWPGHKHPCPMIHGSVLPKSGCIPCMPDEMNFSRFSLFEKMFSKGGGIFLI